MIKDVEKQVCVIHEGLKTSQSHQKSYYDRHHQDVQYEVGDKAYLRVTPLKGVKCFRIKGKLAPRYVGPFPIIDKRGKVSYELQLPEGFPDVHDVFHVSQLKRCFKDPIRGVDHETLKLKKNLTYREVPVRILDEAEQRTRSQTIKFLKIQWSHHSENEATWEQEDRLRSKYPEFFSKT